MAYATITQLRDYLKQVPAGAGEDTKLQDILDRATAIVDEALGFSFAAYGAATTKYVRGIGGPYLTLPIHQANSVTAVTLNTVVVTDWTELAGGTLYKVTVSTGGEGDWGTGRYLVTAVWGVGAAPTAIVEVTLEIAVNIWHSKDAARFSDVIGVEGGGAVGYEKEFTAQQRMVIKAEIAKARRSWFA